MIYPDFTENTESGVTMLFALNGKTEAELLKELGQIYYCYSAAGTVVRDGKKYVALTVEDDA